MSKKKKNSKLSQSPEVVTDAKQTERNCQNMKL